jgi:diacylglycerol kinase (ATP)
VRRRPILLLVNPVAGGKPGSGPGLADDPEELQPGQLAAAFHARSLDVELRELSNDDDPAQLAADAAGRGLDVVVGGGDGTVARVAAGLVGSDAALGILAMGSFNNVARGLGLPTRLAPALEAIAQGETTSVDVGCVSGRPRNEPRYFLEAAGVGIDAAGFVAGEATARRGLRGGLRAAWRALRWRRRPMRLLLDDEPPIETRALMVTVSNAPYYGFGFTVAAGADVHDGKLDVSVFRRMSKLDLLLHFAAVARGRRAYEPRIGRYTAKRVTIEGVRGALPVHVDGRSVGTTPVTFEVQPAALRVMRARSNRSG